MKWELWKDNKGRESYLIAHKAADGIRQELPTSARVVWSCEVDSLYEADYKLARYKSNWIGLAFLKVRKTIDPKFRGKTYKEMGFE